MDYEFTREKVLAERRALAIQIVAAATGGLIAFMATKHRLEDGSSFGPLEVAFFVAITAVGMFIAGEVWVTAWRDMRESWKQDDGL